MAKSQEIKTKLKLWEEKANLRLSEAEALLAEAESIPVQMSNINTLKNAVKRAKAWISKVEALEGKEESPMLDVVEKLVAAGRKIPLKLDKLFQLEESVVRAYLWILKTCQIFLKENSHQNLLEILLPRTDIGVVSAKRKRVQNDAKSSRQQLAQLLGISFDDAATPNLVVEAYKDSEEREFSAMRALRSHNKGKSILDEKETFCTCQEAYHGNMLTCSLCLDHFHKNCVPISHRSKTRIDSELKFICTNCERSKRPKFEDLLSCLVSVQSVKVRIPEGEALQCLTERAMSWQDSARTFLESEELISALLKMRDFSIKLHEIYIKEDGGSSAPNAPREMSTENHEREDVNPFEEEVNSRMEGIEGWREEGRREGRRGERAYSTNRGGRKMGTTSSAVSSLLSGDSPLVTLSLNDVVKLREMLVMGDLLEVDLDEVGHLWRILQCASKPPRQVEEVLASMINPRSLEFQEHLKKKRKLDAKYLSPTELMKRLMNR